MGILTGNCFDFTIDETKSDAPIGLYGDGPNFLPIPLELMQSQAGDIHVMD